MVDQSSAEANAVPSITVIMPVHNGERFLNEAIHSIRTQSFTDFELLVLDDGSTDRSAAIAKRHAEIDPRIEVISLDRCGLTRTLNIGLQRARAPWVARMDADDVAHPRRFEHQMDFLRSRPDIKILGTYAWTIGPTGKTLGTSTLGPVTYADYLRLREDVRINFVHPTVIYSREIVLESGGYSDEYAAAEDFELWNRLAPDHLMLTLPEPLLYYRVHNSSTGTSSMRKQAESWARIRENTLRARQGIGPLSHADFHEQRRRDPALRRVRRELRLRSRHAYRIGGAKIADGNMAGLAWLGLSILYYFPTPLRRFYAQVVLAWFRRLSLQHESVT